MFISLVTKYRDFSYLIGFGVITDVSFQPWCTLWHWLKKNARLCLVQYNPLAYIIETTRYMLLNVGHIHLGLGTLVVTVVLFLVGY
jgi:lipopolysaccharide transport system permease protein